MMGNGEFGALGGMLEETLEAGGDVGHWEGLREILGAGEDAGHWGDAGEL